MVVLHAFLALLAGFATVALLIGVFTVLLKKLTPGWDSDTGGTKPGYMFVNIAISFLAAAVGGYVSAWIAQHNPLIHVLALAIIVLALAALSVIQERGKQPIWYSLTLVALTPIGVLAGGLVRLRVLGIF